ncbi:MAG: efflux RND transporter periplasmic adaptor subunit [Gemmataceae bacterium]|nr:efflux RND transporter periplasmic adaptor subunit [Gemmataceae bacterium]
MRRLYRWALILGGVTAVIAGISVPLKGWVARNSAPKYSSAAVTRGRVETVVNSTGTVKPVHSVVVGAFVSGPIEKIYVDFNSTVTEGQLMARIDPKLLTAAVERDRAALRTQRAELARVEALLQQAKNNEERARRLQSVNKEYLSGTEMDQYHFARLTLEAQKELAEATISQAEANLKNTEANLDYTQIKAPVSGMVIERKVDTGQTVAASFQTPELFVVAPEMEKSMHIYANVDEADIGLIRLAQERDKVVKFTVDAYPGDLFTGRVYQIRRNGTANQNVVTYPVLIEAGNAELKLMPGMTANISFEIEAKDDVVRIPSAAFRFLPTQSQVRDEDKKYIDAKPVDSQEQPLPRSASEKAEQAKNRRKRTVWAVDGEKLRAIPVVLGLIDNQNAELIEGEVKEGDLLVTGLDTGAK